MELPKENLHELPYATAADMATRIYRSKFRHWQNGKPKIILSGQIGSFGLLSFDFGTKLLQYSIYRFTGTFDPNEVL